MRLLSYKDEEYPRARRIILHVRYSKSGFGGKLMFEFFELFGIVAAALVLHVWRL